jgi:hypothetical protein
MSAPSPVSEPDCQARDDNAGAEDSGTLEGRRTNAAQTDAN